MVLSKCAGTWIASAPGVMALLESFFEPLVAGDQKVSLASLSPKLCPFRRIEGPPPAGVLLGRSARQALKGAPWVGSYSVVQCVSCMMGQPLYCSAADAGMWGERLWRWLHPLPMTQQYCIASMAAQLSSTGISHHRSHTSCLTSP